MYIPYDAVQSTAQGYGGGRRWQDCRSEASTPGEDRKQAAQPRPLRPACHLAYCPGEKQAGSIVPRKPSPACTLLQQVGPPGQREAAPRRCTAPETSQKLSQSGSVVPGGAYVASSLQAASCPDQSSAAPRYRTILRLLSTPSAWPAIVGPHPNIPSRDGHLADPRPDQAETCSSGVARAQRQVGGKEEAGRAGQGQGEDGVPTPPEHVRKGQVRRRLDVSATNEAAP
ncbi:uncharacterized protein PSFLO_03625 [Pseudozyma flocculosa]|uniref:Uncharacterized protein n=1 Tax=Pseudozyma flocculosa TaxID=84751 RepID=A0A5C3F150_9BASI|nr:uncharacterized protein PSFLO_03625 [Pseudozyma flocculosa]